MWLLYYIRCESHKAVVQVAQLCPTLCHARDCSPPDSSVHGILQARILEWVAMSSSRGSSRPRDRTQVSHIAGRVFIVWAIREAQGPSYAVVTSDAQPASEGEGPALEDHPGTQPLSALLLGCLPCAIIRWRLGSSYPTPPPHLFHIPALRIGKDREGGDQHASSLRLWSRSFPSHVASLSCREVENCSLYLGSHGFREHLEFCYYKGERKTRRWEMMNISAAALSFRLPSKGDLRSLLGAVT